MKNHPHPVYNQSGTLRVLHYKLCDCLEMIERLKPEVAGDEYPRDVDNGLLAIGRNLEKIIESAGETLKIMVDSELS